MTALVNGIPTMSSVELVELINEMREEGRAELAHSDFMKRIKAHPGIDAGKFSGIYRDAANRDKPCFHLPKREAELMVMSESLEVQTKVYDRLSELEAGPAPQIGGAGRGSESAVDAAKEFRALFGIAKLIGLDKNAAAISANQGVSMLTGTNMLKLLGQTHLEAENQEAKYFTPTDLGKRIGLNGRKFNERLAAAGFQVKHGADWEVTEAGREFSRLFDTGKKHDSGVPVQQVKWASTVIDALPPAPTHASTQAKLI